MVATDLGEGVRCGWCGRVFRGLSTPPVVRRVRLGIEIVLNVPDSTSKRDAIVLLRSVLH